MRWEKGARGQLGATVGSQWHRIDTGEQLPAPVQPPSVRGLNKEKFVRIQRFYELKKAKKERRAEI